MQENDFTIQGIVLQKRYGPFTLENIIDNEKQSPGMGYTIAFAAPKIGKATIFIYNKRINSIPNGPESESVISEFHNAARNIFHITTTLERNTIALIDQYITGTPERGPEFLCATFGIGHNEKILSYLFITGAKNNFVKLRVTLNTDDIKVPTARYFAKDVALYLWNHKENIN